VEVNVSNCSTSAPIAGASVSMSGGFFNTTDGTGGLVTDFSAGPGSYTVNSSRSGYLSGPGSTAPAVVTNGGTTVVNVCLTPTAIAQAASSSMVSEACTPANSALDPGEFVNFSFCVSNTGTADTVSAVGTLQNTGGVTSASPAQNYGVILAGGPAVCRTFSFFVDGALACGGDVTPTVQLQDGATNLGNLVYTTMRTGAVGTPVTSPPFSSVGVVAITDNNAGGVNVNLPVAGVVGEITDVNFRFDTGAGVCDQTVGDVDAGLDHTWVGDVRVRLTAPGGGPNSVLIDQIGVPASQFGLNAENFCAVVLDDEGGFPPIENTTSDPVAGNFSPVNPLSAFDGLAGAGVNGTWVLNAADLAAGDTGSLRRFSLVITAAPRTCQTGGTCSTTPVELLDFSVDGRGRKR
jgi:subtilisin-like proprotein convertase family protein